MSSILPHRIRPTINVNAETGVISWDKVLVDHNEDAFYRGKTVTNDEFNALFVRHALQGDYLADTLEQLFSGGSLTAAVSSTFRNQFHLKPSYIKLFDSTVWGTADAEGYYHIVIPASEHGFAPTESSSSLEAMNIDTEMYVLSNGHFYEVTQVNTTPDNTVTIYTDDNTLTGFVVIRLNDKSYALSEATVDVAQVIGLAPVATSGDFDDLTNTGNLKNRVTAVEDAIARLSSDTVGTFPFVHNADFATNADTAVHLAGENASINNIPISNIFEEGSRVVQEARHATNADQASVATNANIAQYASSDTSKGTIEERLTALGFKQGTIILNSTYESRITVPNNLITREGNRCIANGEITAITGKPFDFGQYKTIGSISEEFRPKVDTRVLANFGDGDPITYNTMPNAPISVIVYTNGAVAVESNPALNALALLYGSDTSYKALKFTNIGWECEPIQII